MIELLLFVVVGILLGWMAFRRFGSVSGTVWNAWRLIVSVMWILSGVFLTLGGYIVAGIVVIALWVFIALGATAELKEDAEEADTSVRREIGRVGD